MIDMHEVNSEISTLEQKDLNYNIAEKLAMLYTIRNNNTEETSKGRNVEVEEKDEDDSDFKMLCRHVKMEKLLDIIEEHMDAIKTVFPKEYDLILRKIEKAMEEE